MQAGGRELFVAYEANRKERRGRGDSPWRNHAFLLQFLALFGLISYATAGDTVFQCDHHFVSETDSNGTFSFPWLPPEASARRTAPSQGDVVIVPLRKGRAMQCIYTFVAGQGQRVKLDFDHFQLAGTSEYCEAEYMDIYSELERADESLLHARLGGRYCGSVSPHVRISLHNVLTLVFHSRIGTSPGGELRTNGRFSFIKDDYYHPGERDKNAPCSYRIDSDRNHQGKIYSPTYPGTYPRNFHCSYLLRGKARQRIKISFRDFDIYFGGEHCPYDSVTIFDGPDKSSPIIRKVCGLQQRMEQYSKNHELLIHFNTTNPPKGDPRGFVMEYEFSTRFVDVDKLLAGEGGVSHMRGTECDVRVESNRETTHYIRSPNYPNIYPQNTTCTYILDGLQGDQQLEKVIINFEQFAVFSDYKMDSSSSTELVTEAPTHGPFHENVECPRAYLGVAINDGNMKATLSSTDESNFDHTLCERIPTTDPKAGPHISSGPRLVLQFGATGDTPTDGKTPLGFLARVEFKTDFGIPGQSVGDSNVCHFRFGAALGHFNSPRYPANYPLDTNCTYDIVAKPGQMILLHFEQFALSEEDKECRDWLEIYDVFIDNSTESGEVQRLLAHYCSGAFPGPRSSSFGSHRLRVIFNSAPSAPGTTRITGNGFKALYDIRTALKEDVNIKEPVEQSPVHCGTAVYSSATNSSSWILSPGYPIKYTKDVHCDWTITARPGYDILLILSELDVEGSISPEGLSSCQKAVIRVTNETGEQEICGQSTSVFRPRITANRTIRITFITAPDKVNGLKGFNFSWTEVRRVEDNMCKPESEYLCTYSKLCIAASLRCNVFRNCGEGDDSDESHCDKQEKGTDVMIIVACAFSGVIFMFIFMFFCYLFKKKLEKKKRKKRKRDRAATSGSGSRTRARQPYRGSTHRGTAGGASETIVLEDEAASRFVHHDATGILPPTTLRAIGQPSQTFYG